jgi:wyosine [tRNA(Phe)-imidazoG37] synthetase (radical SAM superfamily)
MTIPLQSSIVYGPVRSRRLGFSLGINVLSTMKKECSFNCLYCQYGWSPPLTNHQTGPQTRVEEVLEGVEAALEASPSSPGYITFSGNGEPTLHPEFPGLVEGIINLRDRLSPESKTAVLSNSTTVGRPDVKAALSRLDVRIMKLDVGREETLRDFNRPTIKSLSLRTMVDALAALDDVTIQALFAKGPKGNYHSAEIAAWVDCLKRIQPIAVQIYTLARSYPSPDIEPVSREELEGIQHRLNEAGIESTVFKTERPHLRKGE